MIEIHQAITESSFIFGIDEILARDILSVLTLLEGFVGILAVAFQLSMVPLDKEMLGKVVRPYIHSAALLYSTAFLNLIFAVMLIFAGTFLWKLKRSGLMVLVCTLLAEVFYFLCISDVVTYLHRSSNEASRELSKTLAALTGAGNFFLGLQLLTAFPIVAGVLIFFAYRYLGIPPASSVTLAFPTVAVLTATMSNLSGKRTWRDLKRSMP